VKNRVFWLARGVNEAPRSAKLMWLLLGANGMAPRTAPTVPIWLPE
jgi:hypothetical protein